MDAAVEQGEKDITTLAADLDYELEEDLKLLGRVFKQVDLNEDGELSLSELVTGAENVPEFASPGACKWLKKCLPAAWSLSHNETTTTGRSGGAALLKEVWDPIFSGPPQYVPQIDSYLEKYEPFLPQLPSEVSLGPLEVSALKQAVHSMRTKAAGTDGWYTEPLERLPEMAAASGSLGGH